MSMFFTSCREQGSIEIAGQADKIPDEENYIGEPAIAEPAKGNEGFTEETNEENEGKTEEINSVKSYKIEIIGNSDFIEKTNEALDLLGIHAPGHYARVIKYIGIIEWVDEGSGMFAWEDPPLFKVGEATVGAGTVWYAGTIVHDSIHSKQYHDYLAENPSGPVPDEVWTGENAEAQCLDFQYDALEEIGADQETLEYIKNVLETEYWDIEYDKRWW